MGRLPASGPLVVEDDPRIAAVLVKGLRKQGFEADWVTTGGEALERCRSGEVGLLLLDLGMPDIDGLDVLRALVGAMPPVIVITARSDPRDRATALELGAASYFTKPFAWSDIWSAVRAALVP